MFEPTNQQAAMKTDYFKKETNDFNERFGSNSTRPSGRIFQCELCPYNTMRKSDLNRHMNTTHTGIKAFKCDSCSYSTARKCDLLRHRNIHLGDKPLKCDLCPFTTADEASLKKHLKRHSKPKKFHCKKDDCDYATVWKNQFKIHLMNHEGERPFKCNFCNYSTAKKGDFNRHQKIHSGDKPFTCGQCSYSSSRKSGLIAHLMTHADPGPFYCPQCSYSNAFKRNLTVHLRKKHNIDNHLQLVLPQNFKSRELLNRFDENDKIHLPCYVKVEKMLFNISHVAPYEEEVFNSFAPARLTEPNVNFGQPAVGFLTINEATVFMKESDDSSELIIPDLYDDINN